MTKRLTFLFAFALLLAAAAAALLLLRARRGGALAGEGISFVQSGAYALRAGGCHVRFPA